MLLTEKRNSLKTEVACSCGGKAKIQSGTREFFIGMKKISVSNVPNFYCDKCETFSFDSSVRIDELLKFAYKNDMSEIDWNAKDFYLK